MDLGENVGSAADKQNLDLGGFGGILSGLAGIATAFTGPKANAVPAVAPAAKPVSSQMLLIGGAILGVIVLVIVFFAPRRG